MASFEDEQRLMEIYQVMLDGAVTDGEPHTALKKAFPQAYVAATSRTSYGPYRLSYEVHLSSGGPPFSVSTSLIEEYKQFLVSENAEPSDSIRNTFLLRHWNRLADESEKWRTEWERDRRARELAAKKEDEKYYAKYPHAKAARESIGKLVREATQKGGASKPDKS